MQDYQHDEVLTQAEETITRFLRLMEARDLDAASALMAPGAAIIFPGGRQFASQAEMVQASKGRYQRIGKTFDRIDVLCHDETVIVYVMGLLHGVNAYGIEFTGIRYIDRFTLRDGLIVAQEVWNDLAESGVLSQSMP